MRVLVVEDEKKVAAAVRRGLEAEGFAVDVAHDGPSAVERAEGAEPDLVVLDVMLPGFDGLEVCRRLHARRPVPVLMLTARDDETDVLVGLGVGADDYMTKPFSIRELVARVQALLRRVDRAATQAAGELRPAGLSRPMVAAGMIALFGLAAVDPERLIAEHNLARWTESGQLDTSYLSTLSADAVPALVDLPEPARSCVLLAIKDRLGDRTDWRSTNSSRAAARALLDRVGLFCGTDRP